MYLKDESSFPLCHNDLNSCPSVSYEMEEKIICVIIQHRKSRMVNMETEMKMKFSIN